MAVSVPTNKHPTTEHTLLAQQYEQKLYLVNIAENIFIHKHKSCQQTNVKRFFYLRFLIQTFYCSARGRSAEDLFLVNKQWEI